MAAGDAILYVDANVGPAIPQPSPAISVLNLNVGNPIVDKLSAFQYVDVFSTLPGYPNEILLDSPLAYYRMDDTVASKLTDYSGNARDGIYEQGPAQFQVPGLIVNDTNPAVRFASPSRAGIAKAAWMDVAYTTVEAVIKSTTLPIGGASSGIVDRDSNGTRSWQWRIEGASKKLILILWTTTASAQILTGSTVFLVDTIYHVAWTFDGTTAKQYVNGALDGSLTIGGVMKAGVVERITIGSGDQNGQFIGVLDEIAIFNSALPASRIVTHYAISQGNKAYKTEVIADSPAAYWRLGEPSVGEPFGTILVDSSGNGHNGTYAATPTHVPGLLSGETDTAFDGTSTTAAVPYSAWMNSGKITLEAIIKATASGSTRSFFDRDDGNNRIWQFRLDTTNKLNLLFWDTAVGLHSLTGSTTLVAGNEYHVAATYDGTTARLYVNGVQDASVTFTGNVLAASSGMFVAQNGPGGAQRYLGVIDEIAYYTTALSASRIKTHSDSRGISPTTAGPPALTPSLGLASERNLALPVSVSLGLSPINIAAGIASERDIAQPLNISIRNTQFKITTGIASEQDLALPISPLLKKLAFPVVISTGQAVESDIAQRTAFVGAGSEGEPGETAGSAVQINEIPGDIYVDKFYPAQWYIWEAPGEAGSVRFFAKNTQIQVFDETGTDLIVNGPSGDVKFEFDPSVLYTVRVAGTIETTLFWIDGDPSEHDNFDDALDIDDNYGSDEISLVNNQPDGGESSAATGWARFVAEGTHTLTLTFVPDPEDVDYHVKVYRGTSINSLTFIASGTDTMQINVVDGATYYLQFISDDDFVNFEFYWNVEPILVEPEEPYEYLRAFVYGPSGTGEITEIPKRVGVNFQEPLNGVGGGSLSIRMDSEVMEAYPDMFDWRNIVKFFLGNKCVHGFRIQRRSTTYVSTDEWKGYVREVSGPSLQHLLDDIIVKHDGPVRHDSGTSRIYGWPSLRDEWYNSTKWDSPITSRPRSDPPGDWGEEPKKRSKWRQPEKWPDATALWIYRGSNIPGRRSGRMHFRKTFLLSSTRHVRLFAAGDERVRVFVDGEEVISTDSVETGYTDMSVYDMVLAKGPHTVGLYARGLYSLGGDSNDSVIFTMMGVDKMGKPTTAIINSNESWEANFSYPPPSWNRAMVLRNFFKEAKARGNSTAQSLSIGFGKTLDSEGKRWRDRWDEEVEIGTSGLGLQEKLSEGNGFDVWVNPANMTVQAWRRRGTDKSHSITLEPGRNLLDWSIEEIEETRNDFYIQYEGGWTSYSVRSSKRTFGDREAYVSLGNSKDKDDARKTMKGVAAGVASAVKRAGTSEIRTRAEGTPDGGLVAVPGARPFLDFGVGDTVKAPNENGVLKPHRLLGLTCTENEDGTLTYDPELEEIR